ncbi:hypothetical protein [Yimella lutea]|uniref:hypothetical protein n=1 Tax=Yimella lutea TaxID=587872 RepID=UPI001476D807|nr:hypothetical protein [Yimella lutea]
MTDADERLAELDGIELVDLLGDDGDNDELPESDDDELPESDDPAHADGSDPVSGRED